MGDYKGESYTKSIYYMKNSEYILYLDMDEVLSDFNGEYEEYYDALANQTLSITDFFANLDWTHNGKYLWKAVSKMFSDIRLLSTTNSDGEQHAESVAGKKLWAKKNLRTIPEDHVYVVEQRCYKALYASESSILVDDLSDTIREWESRGGIGVLHNDSYVERTLAELDRIINPIKLGKISKRLPVVTRGFWNRK